MIKAWKRCGETPLECLERVRVEYIANVSTEFKGMPMTYVGRLDPMAEGLLIVFHGDECGEPGLKESYLNLDKEYEVGILFGFSTDTYDLLGLPTVGQTLSQYAMSERIGVINYSQYVGILEQVYPPYSSRPVNGVPLFAHARKGTIHEITIPTKHVEIYSIDADTTIYPPRQISGQSLLKYIEEKIACIRGDFRQESILTAWRQVLNKPDQAVCYYPIYTIHVRCSSGTYMRSLVNRIGIDSGISALAFSIRRTRIGDIS